MKTTDKPKATVCCKKGFLQCRDMSQSLLPDVEFSKHHLITVLFKFLLGRAFRFTQEPSDPSYFKKGTNATLAWDYSVDNPQADLQGIVWSVPVGSSFVGMLIKQGDADAVFHPNIPSMYKGRVYIKGRATLVIVNITLQDSTTFRCRLSARPGSGLSDVTSDVRLSVTGTVSHELPLNFPLFLLHYMS